MSWGLLMTPRGSPWRPFLSATDLSPPQDSIWYDLARLADPQPLCRLRLRCDPMGEAAIALDMGAPAETITHVGLISTTLEQGTLRLLGSAADATGAAGEAFDSGALDLAGLAEDESGSIVAAVASAVPAQFLRVALAGQVPEGFVDIGLIIAGAAVVPGRQWQLGAQIGRLDGSVRDRNVETGATFGRPGDRARTWGFAVPHPRAEVIPSGTAPLTDRLRRLHADQQDVLVIPDLADAPAVMSRRAVWGALSSPGGNVLQRFDVATVAWQVTERV